ncbi:RibD family protein [Candidatus Woesearchaeota archaeon]|nr:RibD family protein [Candidatus Woesearchaeota archaeon]
MKPKLIIHNSISLDNSITGFDVNMEAHYRIASGYKPDIMLVGSGTAKAGIKEFLTDIPKEDASDFKKPEIKSGDTRAFWAVVDSKGTLINLLHIFRKSGYCRDVIVLVSEKTPENYIDYLEKRDYDYILAGKEHVDYKQAFETLNRKYNAKVIISDSGPTLNNILIEKKLIDEISLLIYPVLAGNKGLSLFKNIKTKVRLELVKNKVIEEYIHLVYKVS